MKQIKLLVLSILLLSVTLSIAKPPVNTYAPGQTIVVNGNKYICYEEIKGHVTKLYNAANKWTFVDHAKKDGSRIQLHGPKTYTWTLELGKKIRMTLFSCLTFSEFEMLKGEVMQVIMYIDSNTGVISDVEFNIFLNRYPKYAMLPPDRYYRMEQKLKRNILFTLTEEGRTFNYDICAISLIIPEDFEIYPCDALPSIGNVFQESITPAPFLATRRTDFLSPECDIDGHPLISERLYKNLQLTELVKIPGGMSVDRRVFRTFAIPGTGNRLAAVSHVYGNVTISSLTRTDVLCIVTPQGEVLDTLEAAVRAGSNAVKQFRIDLNKQIVVSHIVPVSSASIPATSSFVSVMANRYDNVYIISDGKFVQVARLLYRHRSYTRDDLQNLDKNLWQNSSDMLEHTIVYDNRYVPLTLFSFVP